MTPQYVSLEIAKKLEKTGWSKKCHNFQINGTIYCSDLWDREEAQQEYIEMPALHEILEELPKNCIIYMHGGGIYEASHGPSRKMIGNKNPHDAAALLWMWCVENGYISLPNRDT